MERRLRQRLIRYVRGLVSLDDLATYLVDVTWDLNADAQPVVAELGYSALLAIAEFEHGHMTANQLRDRLLALAHTAYFGLPPQLATASSSLTTQALRWAPPPVVEADRRSEAVLV
jgi:hypothetical protein